MLYALLIFEAEEVLDNYTDDHREAALAGHRGLQNRTKAAGHFVEANQLMPSSSATTVRIRDEKVIVTDGPFAETKELLIGLYVFECETLQHAIDHAAEIPNCRTGAIEVRPVAYFEDIRGPRN